MSTHSSTSSARGMQRRMNSNQSGHRISRKIVGSSARPSVTRYDAYTFALRCAYLSHILQPKSKRLQHTPAPPRPTIQRASSSSVAELVNDFAHFRDSKSTKFPRGFIGELDKRISGVLTGKERSPEYNDNQVKRTFGIFLNELKNPQFRKSMESDRRAEDLILIFYSSAMKELQKGKLPGDDSHKLLVDRHVALFVRLIRSTLQSNSWGGDRPELVTRLQTLENKLLIHDRDLAAASQHNGGAGGTTVEVEVPRSSQVKDMPLVLTVAGIFEKSLPDVQADIDAQKDLWNEKAALDDLKMYQKSLTLHTKNTLNSEDFVSPDGYSVWKKGESQALSELLLEIIQSNKELAKSASGGLSAFKTNGSTNGADADSKRDSAGYTMDLGIDLSSLGGFSLEDDAPPGSQVPDKVDDGEPYIFIPPDPRSYYRFVAREALLHDLRDDNNITSPSPASTQLLSKRSTDLLAELGMRWRIPYISRLIIFLDVVKDAYANQEADLDALDAAFRYLKDPPAEKKKADLSQVTDFNKWPITDLMNYKQILQNLHDSLMRDFFDAFRRCYDTKPPDIGPVMTVLESHIFPDPHFQEAPNAQGRFREDMVAALKEESMNAYSMMYDKHIRDYSDQVEFYHIIQLSKAVVKLVDRIQKRYRKIREVMGVAPFPILVETIMPALASDTRELIAEVMRQCDARGEEIPIEDGFELYREMTELRRVYSITLPNSDFSFHVEEMLETFVWRWIAITDQRILEWVDAAVRQDKFTVRTQDPNQIPTDDERHSFSVIDIFQSFNQAVEQIAELNWADAYQHAKFMTALSKSLGNGITKYCDLLERFFNSEMDRLTPEQEAAMKQTRQQKWMSMAKDAISSKEKIEPFQFLTESFVKLNDIEFAMQQFDRLEKKINVDGCAEAINKRESPAAQRARRNEKCVFTIKIIEAEDLKPCDVNGLSDPYVVLGDEYQKRLAKTRIIYGNLNPRWEETVDIVTQGPLNVIATIWDWDMMGDHDCVGRTSIKLDPSHFRDFMPREYWLDLDTQGRLLVRVSMEGEKDDIQFHFGKTFRTLKRTERDMSRKITDKLSAYIQYSLSRRALKALTVKGMSMASMAGYFQRNRPPTTSQQAPTAVEVEASLKPLFTYFNENFAIMNETLTHNSMISVMTRLWKEVLSTIESLLVPPLSDKTSSQRPLSEQELDVVFKWLDLLFHFFNAKDEETGDEGVPADVLRSPKYHDLKNLHFFYYEPTDNLVRTSERLASDTAERQRQQQARANRLSVGGPPSMPSFGGAAGLLGVPSTRRSKSIMNSRNLGTMRKAKADKRKEAQAEASDDMILRILRMRPEAERYLKDRSRQKERLAAAAAAEMIVRQSLAAGAARDAQRAVGRRG